MPELLTIDDVAKQLRVSSRTVRRILEQPDGLQGILIGKRLRFTQAIIDDYLKRQQRTSTKKVTTLPDWV